MAIKDNKITSWTNPIVNEADRPQRTASEMKAVFDSNSNQLRQALNGLIDDLSKNGAAELPAAPLDGVAGTTVEEQLAGLKKYADERESSAKEYAENLAFKSGAADMTTFVYDPQGKARDVFAYTDESVENLRGDTAVSLAKKENKSTTAQVTLLASAWAAEGEEFAQTVAVAGMDALKNIVVAPAPESNAAYGEAGVYCFAQDVDALVFRATAETETDIKANILVVGG